MNGRQPHEDGEERKERELEKKFLSLAGAQEISGELSSTKAQAMNISTDGADSQAMSNARIEEIPDNAKETSRSKAVTRVGPKTVSTRHLRVDEADRPTTIRALILRDKKTNLSSRGEMGVVLANGRITGREKLDFLAEDMVENFKRSVLGPFNLAQSIKIAESQFHSFLDEITNLRDSSVFAYLISEELKARTLKGYGIFPKDEHERHYVTTVITAKIHNTYLLAAAWRLVLNTLRDFEADGHHEKNAKNQLKKDEKFRHEYLALYDFVTNLVEVARSRVAVLCTTSSRYAKYFKEEPKEEGQKNTVVAFDRDGLKEACKSFLDSIVLELCFPSSAYPKHILYQLLHDAIEEAPYESNRFSQLLWDSIGDLSVTLEMLEMLERALVGPIGDGYKKEPREKPQKYLDWERTQEQSDNSTEFCDNFTSLVIPLTKTSDPDILHRVWVAVDHGYKRTCECDAATLWGFGEEDEQPQVVSRWHPHLAKNRDGDSKLAQIINEGQDVAENRQNPNRDKEYDSLPDLRSDSDSDEFSDDDEIDSGDESGYDTEQEEEIRGLFREAMDIVAALPEEPEEGVSRDEEIKNLAKKGNPFLRLLGSLGGRKFTTNVKLRTSDQHTTTTTKASDSQTKQSSYKKPAASQSAVSSVKPEAKADKGNPDDEDNAPVEKKKKKKPKKKKKTAGIDGGDEADGEEDKESLAPNEPPVIPQSPVPSHSKPILTSQSYAKQTPTSPARRIPNTPHQQMSTTSLATAPVGVIRVETAQSAHAYLQHLETPKKDKVKTRPDQASVFSLETVESKTSKKSKSSKKKKAEDGSEEEKEAKMSWFAKLKKKTKESMHLLLGTLEDETQGMAPMKWDTFLRIMRDMGFSYDPSTAGSSVRFDPPNPADGSITFHKPHPHDTLQPHMVKVFSKRLQKQYGWCKEDFLMHVRQNDGA